MKPTSETPITDLNEMYPWQVRHMYERLDYPKVVLASVARQLEKELNQLKQQCKIASVLTATFKDINTAKAYKKSSIKYHNEKRKQLGL